MRPSLICFFLALPIFLAAQNEAGAPESRCRYRPSREFILSKTDTCFNLTRQEANRAFSLRCWDEAMALYRAAKSCANANQKARMEMNKRIQACRDSSEQELRDSEQQARRQLLHATAGNLAEDAKDLLKNYDRSLSYRLADFAGQYIAPGPNGKCLQALLDAWYYEPPIQPGTPGYKDFQVPFCYQLDYDLGSNVQVRFGGRDSYQRLYAYAPASRQLYSWDTGEFKPGKPTQIEEGFTRFDISPDGKTMLFFSDKNIQLRRGRSEVFRINAANVQRYCFSNSGDEFLYFDESESKIYLVDMEDAYAQRKGSQRPGPKLLVPGVQYEVLGMAYYEGRIWLGGRDSLVVLQRAGKEAQWLLEKSVAWSQPANVYATGLQLFPDRQAAVFIYGTGAVYIPIAVNDGLPQSTGQPVTLRGTPLAIRQDVSLVAHSQSDNDLLYLLTTDSGAVRHGAYLHPDDEFMPMNGAFSPDYRWFSAATDTGTLKLWALTELKNDASTSLAGDDQVEFSPNGDYFCRYRHASLEMFATDTPHETLYKFPDTIENCAIQAVSRNWVVYGTGENFLRARQTVTGKMFEFSTDGTESQSAIDDAERFVAYTVRADSVVVRSLVSGAVVAQKSFNGYVNRLHFVPNTGEIVIIQRDQTESDLANQTIAKIWNPSGREEPSRTVRLHDYNIQTSARSADGTAVALSNGRDIRIFRLDNLLDENARIRQNGEHFVTAVGFSPNGSALAAGYDDGTIVVWDLANSEPLFHLQTNGFWIESLSFSASGGRLRIKTIDGSLFFRDIDPGVIRDLAQTTFRRLLAFTPVQIREYGLEKALDYSGNFQRLAESHDLPLIRSFFEYYREQALSSNNIARVKSYFESASRLYSKLDDPVTQHALRPTMLEIYEDYIWKLLLRERNSEAERLVNEFNRLFDKPLPAIKSGAFTALMRNDLANAARLFTNYTIWVYENPASQPYLWATLDSLQQKFKQLSEYNLLQGPQRECICGMYSKVLDIKTLCPTIGNTAAVPFDVETRLRWNIFQNLYTAAYMSNHSEKVRLLQQALDDAKALYRRNPTVWRGQLEKAALRLAQAYTDRGTFEQENVVSAKLYRQALNLLDTFGTFTTLEPARLKALISSHGKLGDYLASTDKIPEAIREYEAGYRVAEKLIAAAPVDSLPSYRNDRIAPLLTQLGMARLLEGNTVAAKKAFDQAYESFTYGLYSYFYGHVDLMEGRETDALRRYGEIYSELQLGDVLFTISRLADRFPAQRARLEAFVPKLREMVQREHPEISAQGIDYRFAVQKGAYASANERWAEALEWNEKSLDVAKQMVAGPDPSDLLKGQLLDAMLSQSFYLLHAGIRDTSAFSRAIQCAESAEQYAEEQYSYYPYRDWLQTNRAHAYLLRNHQGDRNTAIDIYRAFLKKNSYAQDYWELLQKDFRDLYRAGIRWPDLENVIRQIKPADIQLSKADWRDMGVEHTGTGTDQR